MVLDIGQVFTKAGFSGEGAPRHVFKSELGSLSEARNTEQWLEIVRPYLKRIYFDILHVNPTDRRVILCENAFWQHSFKAALVQGFLEIKAVAVIFLPARSLPMYCSGRETGIVVDVGWSDTRVQAVGQGFPLAGSLQSCGIGMQSVHARFKQLADEVKEWDELDLDDMVARTVVVRALSEEEEKRKTAAGHTDMVDLTVPDTISDVKLEKVVVSRNARGGAAEALFGVNEDGQNIAASFLDSLLRCAVDSRADVVSNVVICGGTSMLPGFHWRFLQEVSLLLGNDKYASLKGLKGKISLTKLAFPQHTALWVSGSLVGGMKLDEKHFITTTNSKIHDWTKQEAAPVIISEEFGEDEEESDTE